MQEGRTRCGMGISQRNIPLGSYNGSASCGASASGGHASTPRRYNQTRNLYSTLCSVVYHHMLPTPKLEIVIHALGEGQTGERNTRLFTTERPPGPLIGNTASSESYVRWYFPELCPI